MLDTAEDVPPTAVPFSPTLLFGLAVEKLPVSLVQAVAESMLSVVLRRHPGCLERMGEWSQRVVCIDPVDLPFVILLRPDAGRPSLRVQRRGERLDVSATIHGPLVALIALAEGRVDGDTLFFSRELRVEGDTEVVVALRNAVDGAGIDLVEDVGAAFGPLAAPFRQAARGAGWLLDRFSADLATLSSAVVGPVLRATDLQARQIADLESEIAALRRIRARARSTA